MPLSALLPVHLARSLSAMRVRRRTAITAAAVLGGVLAAGYVWWSWTFDSPPSPNCRTVEDGRSMCIPTVVIGPTFATYAFVALVAALLAAGLTACVLGWRARSR